MLRTSTHLAIALCMTAIGSATTPAAAFSSQVFGGNSRIAAQLYPATASNTVQPNHETGHILTGVSPHPAIQLAGPSNTGKIMIPTPKAGPGESSTVYKSPDLGKLAAKEAEKNVGSVQNAQDSCATNPKLCSAKGTGSVQNSSESCATNPKLCGPTGGPYYCDTHKELPMCGGSGGGSGSGSGSGSGGKGSGHGPVVIFVPQAPVQVPVYVPGPSRVFSRTSSVAAAQPVIPPHCVTTGNIPALAAGIDQLLPAAQLSAADMTKVTELRQMIQVMSTDGKMSAARDIEEVAMNLLGYQKIWLRCGLGTFDWEQVASNDAVQSAGLSK